MAISLPIEYRKGSLNDVSKLKFAEGLSVSGESTEFNVLCMDQKFWVAVQADAEIGIIVIGRGSQNELRIMHPEVAPARKNGGMGSALLRAVIVHYPEYKLSVIPFEGTEGFYSRLGFLKVGRWGINQGSGLVSSITRYSNTSFRHCPLSQCPSGLNRPSGISRVPTQSAVAESSFPLP